MCYFSDAEKRFVFADASDVLLWGAREFNDVV